MTDVDSTRPRRRSSKARSVGRAVFCRAMSVLIGLLAGGLLAEALLHVAGIKPPKLLSKRILVEESDRSVEYHCYPTNPNGEFQPLPDVDRGRWHLLTYNFEPAELPLDRLSQTPWCVRYKYSSKFIRDREYPPVAPAGVLRIAGIGDSFVLGEGVPLEKTLCHQVERVLGDGYQVINGGQSGIGTAEELDVLHRIVAGAGCRRALFVFIPNDVALTPELQNRQRYINDLINIRDQYLAQYESRAWYTGHSRLLHFIGAHFAMERIERETIQWYLDCYSPRYNARNLRRWQEDIRSLAEMPQCRVAFVLYPLMEGFETGYPLAPIHEYAAATAEATGLPVLDLAPVFAGRRTSSLWVHPTDHHPNGKAHALAARAIAGWLRTIPGFLDIDDGQ